MDVQSRPHAGDDRETSPTSHDEFREEESVLYFDNQSRLRLCKERADQLAQHYRRAQRPSPRRLRSVARSLSLVVLPRRESKRGVPA
jgi:hypothetical protein